MKSINSQSGYIALISAILISVSLLTLVIAVSFEGFYSRFNVLESEQKELSAYLAESCFNTALIKVTQDEAYNDDPETITVGSQTCEIVSVEPGTFPSERVIKTKGVNGQAVTNLQVEADFALTDVAILTWEEVGDF